MSRREAVDHQHEAEVRQQDGREVHAVEGRRVRVQVQGLAAEEHLGLRALGAM